MSEHYPLYVSHTVTLYTHEETETAEMYIRHRVRMLGDEIDRVTIVGWYARESGSSEWLYYEPDEPVPSKKMAAKLDDNSLVYLFDRHRGKFRSTTFGDLLRRSMQSN